MNWENIILALLASLPPTLVAIAAFRRQGTTHDLVNSRMTELLEVTRTNAANKATLVEKKAERVRRTVREKND